MAFIIYMTSLTSFQKLKIHLTFKQKKYMNYYLSYIEEPSDTTMTELIKLLTI